MLERIECRAVFHGDPGSGAEVVLYEIGRTVEVIVTVGPSDQLHVHDWVLYDESDGDMRLYHSADGTGETDNWRMLSRLTTSVGSKFVFPQPKRTLLLPIGHKIYAAHDGTTPVMDVIVNVTVLRKSA